MEENTPIENVGEINLKRRSFVAMSAMALASAMVGATGCAPQKTASTGNAPALSFTPGTYTGEGTGRKGPVRVEVVFSDAAIDSITVLEGNYETPRISKAPFERIPADIVELQSLNVDTITGATLSSQAVLTAVKDCVEQAGGSVSALEKGPSREKAQGEKTIDTEIAIIGAGASGMAAAIEASIRGARVTVMEQCANIGGNALVSGGNLTYIEAPEAIRPEMTDEYRAFFEKTMARAKEIGVPQDMLDVVRKQYDDYNASGSTKLFDSLEWYDIYCMVGPYSADEYTEELYQETHDFNAGNKPLLTWLEQFVQGQWRGCEAVAGYPWPNNAVLKEGEAGEGYFAAFDRYLDAENQPIEFLFSTTAQELVLSDEGRVTGVVGVCDDGTTYIVNASKAVIIATGGFAGNPDLVREYDIDDEWGFKDMDYIPHSNNYGHVGSGLQMAIQAGGQGVGGGFMVVPWSNQVDYSIESIVGDSGNCLLVNKNGERYVDESISRNEIAHALMEQPDAVTYVISDKNNSRIVDGVTSFGMEIDQLLMNGKAYRADTLEELAETLGMDPAVLTDTVAKFNGYASAGSDPEFGRTYFTSTSPVVEGPFYASACTWAVLISDGGINIDWDTLAVLDKNDQPIPGLFAIGEAIPSGGGIDVMTYGIQVIDGLYA